MKKMIFLKVKNSYNKKLVTWLDLNLQVALYYEKLNKSKSTDDITKESKNEDIINDKDIEHKKAAKNLFQFLEENKPKQCLEFS